MESMKLSAVYMGWNLHLKQVLWNVYIFRPSALKDAASESMLWGEIYIAGMF